MQLNISDMQLFEVECIIFPDIYTPLLRMDFSYLQVPDEVREIPAVADAVVNALWIKSTPVTGATLPGSSFFVSRPVKT